MSPCKEGIDLLIAPWRLTLVLSCGDCWDVVVLVDWLAWSSSSALHLASRKLMTADVVGMSCCVAVWSSHSLWISESSTISCVVQIPSLTSVLFCWKMCRCCTNHIWLTKNTNGRLVVWWRFQYGCLVGWWLARWPPVTSVMTPGDADKDMWNRYCELRSTVLVHCKMHVSPISMCLEWGCPLLAVGDLKMREPNARSKAPVL